MYSTYESDVLPKQRSNFLFSFIFTISFLAAVQLFSIFAFFYNLIIFPFTLIHELSHCFALNYFFPGKKAQIEFHLFENGVTCANVKFESLSPCFGAVVSFLAGSLTVITLSVFGIIALRKFSSDYSRIGSQFLKFVLLCDIPNLFPIHPPMVNAVTDGYAASVYLFQMGYTPFVSTDLSILLYSIAAIISFTAFFYLGATVYYLLLAVKGLVLKENRSFQPQFI
ncbi:MAG: hypothetical protein ACFFDC_07960 [Promethearchaeota archaeon]